MLGLDVRSITKLVACSLALVLGASLAEAGSITRPTKTFGGTSFINGVIPQASDFNGDLDTIYSEFNGAISNANISASAAIAASKISPDGFTANVRTVTTEPCYIWDESDQSADARRWAACVAGGGFVLRTTADVGTTQNTWLTISRANGSFTLGSASATHTINGATTFNHAVTFTGGTSLTPTGMISQFMGLAAPSGWLLMDGSTFSCTGGSAANANLCTQLVSLYGTANYKGAASSTVTVDTGSDEVIHVAHGLSIGDRVHFTSTTTLPAPLSATTVYCVQSVIADRYKVTGTCGAAAIDITTAGTGTHSDYFNFVTPDMRGRNPIGTGTGAGLTARTIGATGGEETHTLTASESGTAVHNHGVTDPGHTHSTANAGYGTNTSDTFDSIGSGATNPPVTVTGSSTTGLTVNNHAGASASSGHNVMDPWLVVTFIIKL